MKPVALFVLCSTCDGHGWLSPASGPEASTGPCPLPRTELCCVCLGKGCRLSTDGQSIIGLLGVAGLPELMPDF